MAGKFYVNSAGTKAIRVSEIEMVYIEEDSVKNEFSVKIKTDWIESETLETASSLADAQAKAAPLMALLEE
jgi:hypothetical protein